MIRARLLLFAMLVGAAVAGSAQAAVHLRLGVQPDTLAHCDRGHAALALWNDGTDTLRVRLYVSLRLDSLTLGPRTLRTRLAPSELRQRSFDFEVPPFLPVGRYELRIFAVASDSSRSEGVAVFVVRRSGCSSTPSIDAPSAMLDAIADATGFDIPTPTIQGSWGQLKRRYGGR